MLHYENMQLSQETIDGFITRRDETTNNDTTRRNKIYRQVLRASRIAQEGYFDIGPDNVTYDTRWANIAYDPETDLITQARLHGVYERRAKLFRGALSCVHLYLRPADADMPTKPPRFWEERGECEYAALFSGHRNEESIKIPKESYGESEPRFPQSGDYVEPDTPKWRELDFVLSQIALRPK